MRAMRFVVPLLVLFLMGCDAASTTSTAQPTAPSAHNGFPAFSDYRATYVGQDYYVHAVTLDGKTDVKGLKLPNLTNSQGANMAAIGTSPDGRYFAYTSSPTQSPQFSIVDLASATSDEQAEHYFADTHLVASYDDVIWSPDGQHLAAFAQDVLYLTGLKDTDFQPIPHTEDLNLIGWQDNQHIIGQLYKTTRAYVSIDISSGQQQTLFRFPSAGAGIGGQVLSPDGRYLLFFNDGNAPGSTQPSRVALIDLTTGTYKPLPNLLQKGLVFFNTIAWKSNTLEVAVGLGNPRDGGSKSYLLDLKQDTATALLNNQMPQRWSPDGTTLIVADGEDWQVDRGPYTISAVQFGADGKPQVAMLTNAAYTFPFPGFVKSA